MKTLPPVRAKKTAVFPAVLLLISAAACPQEDGGIPPLLQGDWENSGRIVSFSPDSGESAIGRVLCGITLKMFYARYNDRAAGADAGTPRDRNDTAAPQAEVLVTSFEETTPETGTSGSWVIRIRYPPYRETSAIDAAVIGGNLYLSFFIRDGGTSAEDLRGFWRGAGTASGVTLSRPWFADSMESLYITGEAVFRIRYWPLASDAAPDMGAEARFSDGASEYRVSKYIRSGDRIFTCVQGRGARIRQVTKSPLPPEGVTLSENGKLCTFSKPYLTGANHVVDKVSSGMVE